MLIQVSYRITLCNYFLQEEKFLLVLGKSNIDSKAIFQDFIFNFGNSVAKYETFSQSRVLLFKETLRQDAGLGIEH